MFYFIINHFQSTVYEVAMCCIYCNDLTLCLSLTLEIEVIQKIEFYEGINNTILESQLHEIIENHLHF